MGRLNPLKTKIGDKMKQQRLYMYGLDGIGGACCDCKSGELKEFSIDDGWLCYRCLTRFPVNIPFGLKNDQIYCHSCMKEMAEKERYHRGLQKSLADFIPNGEPGPKVQDVAHQSHYTECGIQPIDYMRANMTQNEFMAYCIGNVIKYVSRYKRKNGLEDLKKAKVYLDWTIERMSNDD